MCRRPVFFACVLFPLLLLCMPLFAGTRGVAVRSGAGGSGWGDFHALIVGINEYQEWNPLQTAVKDAVALKAVLVEKYGFSQDGVVLLTDRQASRGRIILALRRLASGLTKTDNLLIYFAGHGQIDAFTGDGYWIPAEGKLKDPTTWVSHSTVKNILSSESLRAKNVVLVADACYSGTLLREGPSTLVMDQGGYLDKLRTAAARSSRQVITSGGMEPVADGGRDGHSLFAYYFLKALKENDREVIDLENLFHTRVWKPVAEIGRQRPSVGRLQTPMDDDGQFVLTNRAAAQKRAEQAEAKRRQTMERQQWRKDIEKERARIEAEKKQLEAEKRLLAQRRELELEKIKLEQEKQRLAIEAEKARLEAERRAMALEASKTAPAAGSPSGKIAAASAPLPRPAARLPLKIALMPWKIRPSTAGSGAQHINIRSAFNQVMETVAKDDRFSVSHSVYDFDPPAGSAAGDISPLALGPEEAKSLWKKDGFFSRSQPNTEQALALAEKAGFDVAVFISEFEQGDEQLELTLVDRGSGRVFSSEQGFYYLTFGPTLDRALTEQLEAIVRQRQ